jgi:hypothetical protein
MVMHHVQSAGVVETAARICAHLGGLMVVPILLAFGFTNWIYVESEVATLAERNRMEFYSFALTRMGEVFC